jgi:lipopolysaccharide transport system permease protein
MSMQDSSHDSVLVIEPGRIEKNYWGDLWRYRELFLILAWRDISVRYKQTVIGIAWAVIRPVLTMVVFTVIFGTLAKMKTEIEVPYPLFVLVGTLPWSLFSTSLSEAAGSLVNNSNLISKVYFPRMIVPSATIVTAFVDFLIGLIILIGFMAYYAVSGRYTLGWSLLLFPALAALSVVVSLGPGLWSTALTVKYRDFRHVMPFVVQLGAYISPVGFPSSKIPAGWRLLFSVNPMVGVIDGFRWCVFGGQCPIYWPGFALSLGVGFLLLWLGIRKFRKTERSFADLI